MRRHPSARKPVTIAAATWILATAGCGSSGEPASPEQEAVVTVAEARGLAEGSVATVEGVVTVAPGTFNSSTGDQGFALQDTTGGIYVSLPDALDLDLDRRVRVTGRLGQTAEQTVLNTEAASVAALDGTEPVEPRDVTTGEVGEPIEGTCHQPSAPAWRGARGDARCAAGRGV